VAFAAVVTLAVAANLLIEHEISVVRTTRIVRVEASPLIAPGDIGTRPTPVSPPAQIETLSAKSLVAALEHFVAAVRNRVDIHNDNSDGELVAAALELEGRLIKDVRIAFGGVAHKPWRAFKAEAVLRGGPANEQAYRDAAIAELADARPLRDNGFKVELATRVLVAVLGDIAGAGA